MNRACCGGGLSLPLSIHIHTFIHTFIHTSVAILAQAVSASSLVCHAHRAVLKGDLPHNEPPGPVRRGPRHPHLVDILEHYDTHEVFKVVPRLSSVPDIHVSQLDMAGSCARRHSLSAMRHRMAETSSRICSEVPSTQACSRKDFQKCHAPAWTVEEQQQTEQSSETHWRASCILMGQA